MSANDREAFKDEHKRMMTDYNQHLDDNNYNKITSPSKKYMIEDGELKLMKNKNILLWR